MHNKLLVADNTVALVGGRNIGNQYFQMDPESQFADDDVFVAGPIAAQAVGDVRRVLEQRVRDSGARPCNARSRPRLRLTQPAPAPARGNLRPCRPPVSTTSARLASGEPYAGMISGRLPLVWAHAQVICDSPDKKNVESGVRSGRLMTRSVANAAGDVQSELLMVTPYFVPADEELQLLKDMRDRHARVRILTNSLESNPDPAAHSGYKRYRVPLLEDGVELHEVRSLLESTKGSGQTAAVSRYGNYCAAREAVRVRPPEAVRSAR